MERKYGFFAKVRDSIIKPRIAVYVIDSQGGKAVRYLILLCLLSALLLAASMFIPAYPLGGLERFVDNIPGFELRDGRLDLDIAEPLVYESSDTGVVIAENGNGSGIIDQYEDFSETIFYFNSERVYIKQGFRSNSLKWSDINLELSNVTVGKFILGWTWALILVAALFALGFGIIGSLIFALIASVIGLIVNEVLKTALKFGQLFSLVIYAMTAGKVIQIIFSAVNYSTPLTLSLPTWLNYVLTICFLTAYLLALKKHKKEEQVIALPETN